MGQRYAGLFVLLAIGLIHKIEKGLFMLKKVLIVVAILFVLLMVRFVMLGQSSQSMDVKLGLDSQGKLLECKSTSNCVISYNSQDAELKAHVSETNPIAKVEETVKAQGMTVVSKTENYIYAIHKSAIFGFVDDVEFLYNTQEKKLHFRSSSRVGKSDLGANKKRVLKVLSNL